MTAPLYSWADRLDNYTFETGLPEAAFAASTGEEDKLYQAADGRIVGMWIMGNDYRVKSGYYGGYPNTYLRRVRALFRDRDRVLHLFSGRVDLEEFPGDTVDLNADFNPTYLDDAQTLANVPLHKYDLVLADPPYSVEDAEHYQTSMVKRNKVFRALQRLPHDAYVVWLDQVLPMWSKQFFTLEALIGIVRSSNHRFRVASVFRRVHRNVRDDDDL